MIIVFVVIIVGDVGSVRGVFAPSLLIGVIDTVGHAYRRRAQSGPRDARPPALRREWRVHSPEKLRAAAVKAARRLERWNSLACNSFSSSQICTESSDYDTCRRPTARSKCRSSATATK